MKYLWDSYKAYVFNAAIYVNISKSYPTQMEDNL